MYFSPRLSRGSRGGGGGFRVGWVGGWVGGLNSVLSVSSCCIFASTRSRCHALKNFSCNLRHAPDVTLYRSSARVDIYIYIYIHTYICINIYIYICFSQVRVQVVWQVEPLQGLIYIYIYIFFCFYLNAHTHTQLIVYE